MLSGPWTPTQETALYKLIIHHKPTGLHKHMHMLSIYHSLRSQGHVHLHSNPSQKHPKGTAAAATYTSTPHLRIPALWEKLRQLYDLEALDEREDSWRFGNLTYDEEGDVADPSSSSSPERGKNGAKQGSGFWAREFALDGHRKVRHGPAAWDGAEGGNSEKDYPDGVDVVEAEDFAKLMFERRINPSNELSESPPPPTKTTEKQLSASGGAVGKRKRGLAGSNKRQSQASAAGGRRASKATATTASSDGDGTPHKDDEGDEEEEQGSTAPTRRRTRGAATKGK